MRRLLTFADICSCFRACGRPVQILGLEGGEALRPQGCLAAIPEGARVVALSFAPEEYFNKGCWELHDRSAAPYLSWRYEGKANAKIGYGCAQVTGRAGALRRRSAGDWVLVVLL
jgi:hypothetical protein